MSGKFTKRGSEAGAQTPPLLRASSPLKPKNLTQNPKTDPKETRVILGRTVLERRKDDAEEGSYGGADRCGAAAGAAGEKVADICRKVGISEGTYYAWKKQFAGLGITELRELRQLREENGRLKRLVADLSLDRQILQEIVSKKL
jgi:putative transposase